MGCHGNKGPFPDYQKEPEVGQKCYKNRLSNGIYIISQVNTCLNLSTEANVSNVISALCNSSLLYMQFTPKMNPGRSSLHSPACISHLLFYNNFANSSNRDNLSCVLMQNPAEDAFRADISEITKFYISLKNSINYEQMLLFFNLQCLCKSLIPFQDAQQCVLSWTLLYTHYLTSKSLGWLILWKAWKQSPVLG